MTKDKKKPVYESPVAVLLNEIRTAIGICKFGSSAVGPAEVCQTGTVAGGTCKTGHTPDQVPI